MRLVKIIISSLLLVILSGCATSSAPIVYNVSNVEVFPQAEENQYIVVVEGTDSEDKLFFDCKYRLAQLAIEKNFTGFYIRDKNKQETIIPHTYTNTKGRVTSYNEKKLILRIHAMLGESNSESMQYYVAQDILSQGQKNAEEMDRSKAGAAILSIPILVILVLLSA